MYRHNHKQLEFSDFYLPFGGKLSGENRWVKLAQLIPWAELEELYASNFSKKGMGAPAKSVRMALGALLIKEKLGSSDEETVEQIRENPYLQFFLGLYEFSDKAPFDPSMFVHFRKRFNLEDLSKINDLITTQAVASRPKSDDDNHKPTGGNGSGMNESAQKVDSDKVPNCGKLLVDATCTPADITFPTDLKLLNQAREISEKIIDKLHAPLSGRKPRTYRQNARRDFLNASKSKKLSAQKRRKAMRKQLDYLERNLGHIEILKTMTPLTQLERSLYRKLLVINELYRQQRQMFQNKSRSAEHRIVSISQPHVRPIVRGKAAAKTEFGAKVSASVVDGYTFLDRLDWESFNEAGDLKGQIEKYRERFGYYPASVHADKIYRNRENRAYCKERGIRLAGPALGRPPKNTEENLQMIVERKRQERQDEVDRIPIEGKFGQGKRRYSLDRVMAKLATTAECAIGIVFLVMNLDRWLKELLSWLFTLLDALSFRVRMWQKLLWSAAKIEACKNSGRNLLKPA